MPPGSKSAAVRKSPLRAATDEPSEATVYRLDVYRDESGIEPFVLDTGDAQIEIQPPTGEQMLAIAETNYYDGRTLLKLICGDQHEAVWEVMKSEQATVLMRLLKDLSKHFKLANVAEVPGGHVASLS